MIPVPPNDVKLVALSYKSTPESHFSAEPKTEELFLIAEADLTQSIFGFLAKGVRRHGVVLLVPLPPARVLRAQLIPRGLLRVL